MGFWGLGLYDNDTTSDIKSFCECQYWKGYDSKEVQAKAIKKFSDLIGTDEEPLFWLVLADIQWDFGEVIDEIKDKALSLIEKHAFSENFQKLSDKKGWEQTLLTLNKKLNKTPPVQNEINVRANLKHHNWKKGDVFAYRFESRDSVKFHFYNKYILFQALTDEEEDNFGYLSTTVQFFNKLFDNIPCDLNIENLKILPIDNANRFFQGEEMREIPLNITARMEILCEDDFPENQITFIKNQKVVNKDIHKFEVGYPTGLFWNELEDYLCEYCWSSWQNHSLEIKDSKILIL
jgi:hypothetical protein